VMLEPSCGRWQPLCHQGRIPVGTGAGGPVGQGPASPAGRQWPTSSFSVLGRREDFHGLGVQGIKVSVLPCTLPQPSMSPASQQGL
jgi:hypothetical protein